MRSSLFLEPPDLPDCSPLLLRYSLQLYQVSQWTIVRCQASFLLLLSKLVKEIVVYTTPGDFASIIMSRAPLHHQQPTPTPQEKERKQSIVNRTGKEVKPTPHTQTALAPLKKQQQPDAQKSNTAFYETFLLLLDIDAPPPPPTITLCSLLLLIMSSIINNNNLSIKCL